MLENTLALLERYEREVKRVDLDNDWETWVKVGLHSSWLSSVRSTQRSI